MDQGEGTFHALIDGLANGPPGGQIAIGLVAAAYLIGFVILVVSTKPPDDWKVISGWEDDDDAMEDEEPEDLLGEEIEQ